MQRFNLKICIKFGAENLKFLCKNCKKMKGQLSISLIEVVSKNIRTLNANFQTKLHLSTQTKQRQVITKLSSNVTTEKYVTHITCKWAPFWFLMKYWNSSTKQNSFFAIFYLLMKLWNNTENSPTSTPCDLPPNSKQNHILLRGHAQRW